MPILITSKVPTKETINDMTDHTQEAGKALKSLLGHFAAIFYELQQLQNKPDSSEAQTYFIRGITAIASDARKNLDDFTSIVKPVNAKTLPAPIADALSTDDLQDKVTALQNDIAALLGKRMNHVNLETGEGVATLQNRLARNVRFHLEFIPSTERDKALPAEVIHANDVSPKAETANLKKIVARLHGKSVQDEEIDAFREKLEKQVFADIVANYNDGKYDGAAGALTHMNMLIPKH